MAKLYQITYCNKMGESLGQEKIYLSYESNTVSRVIDWVSNHMKNDLDTSSIYRAIIESLNEENDNYVVIAIANGSYSCDGFAI